MIVGGTKNVDFEKLRQLKPDLIIANKEENVKDQIEELATICPVYVSDVSDLGTAMAMILQVGLLVSAKLQSELLVQQLADCFSQLPPATGKNIDGSIKAGYLIWRKPYMAAGAGTFISDMLERCGLQNAFSHTARYPEITIEDLHNANCRILLLSSEPYPFQQKHLDELQFHLPQTKIHLVDGEMFSWYGSRMLNAPEYFTSLRTQLNIK